MGSGRYSISLQQHVPVKPVAERRLQFTVDSSMLDELVATFGLDQLRKDIPPECQLHPAARQLLQSSAGLQPQDKVANLVVFVDGSLVAKHGACAWSFAAFESRPTALIWLGYMAGVVPDQACGGKPSAFRAEIFAQLMAHLFGVAQESRRITFVYDATSAAMVAAGDCAIEDDDALARKLVAAGVLARSMGKTLRQVHTKSHSGNPGNELVDSLASHAACCYVDLQAPTSCYSWLLDEQIIDWLWLVPQSHDDPRLPPLAEDGAFVAQTITSDAAGRQAPVAFRPGQGGACLQPNYSANVKARFRLMTYNALSLRSCGQGHALTHEMRRLGVHVLALQECREEVEKIRFQNGICKLAGPAQGGHFGCQIWIDCEKPVGQLEDGVPVAWNKKAFAILHSDPRMLVVGAQIGAQRFAIVSAHACTTAATAVDCEKFSCELAVAMRRVPRGYVPILLIDANARFEHGTLAPIKGCNNATKLRELARQNDMWLSGNTDKHGRPLVTWVAPGSNTGKACLDYIAIPQAWSLGAEVVGDPGLLDVHAGFDHFPVAVDFEACVAYHRCEKTVGIDVEQLHSPEGQAKAEQIFANAPTIPWHVDVDSHLESVNEYLAREFSIAFPRCRKPRNPALSEISWRIVAQRRQLRRQLERSTSLQHRLLLHTCLRAWQRARRDKTAGRACVPTGRGLGEPLRNSTVL